MTEKGHEFIMALKDLMSVIESNSKGMIIGGMAVIALGYPRVTTDIDATVIVPIDDLESFIGCLNIYGIVPRMNDVLNFARTHHVLLMKHKQTDIDIDISIALLPFEEEAISKRQTVNFAGVRITIPRVDDLIIYKMVASRPEDIRDVEELLLRYSEKINFSRISNVIKQFADILETPEMVDKFDKLVNKYKKK